MAGLETIDQAPYLGIQLAKLTVPEYIDVVRQACASGHQLTFTYVHLHTMNLIQQHAGTRAAFRRIDVVTPDGIGVLWSTRWLGRPLRREHIIVNEYAMSALGPAAVRAGWSFYLFGGELGIADRAAAKLSAQYPGLKIAGLHHGQIKSIDEMERVVREIASVRPTIVMVGLGQPKQEEWINRYRSNLGATAVVGVGGYLEKLARRRTVYPRWVNRTHLYWLYRLMTEPRRVWRRYSFGALQFAWCVSRARFQRHT